MVERRAVIHGGNDALVDMYTFDQSSFMSEVHNADRNIEIPAGVFRLAWREVRDGAPAAFYGHDGVHWHVVVLMRVDERYIRLRLRPRSDSGLRRTRAIYAAVAAVEEQATEAGLPRGKVAELGADELLAQLGNAGIAGSMALSEYVLRHEMPTPQQRPDRPADSVGSLIKVLHGLAAVEIATGRPAALLRELVTFRDELATAVTELPQMQRELRELGRASVDGADRFAATAPVLANTGTAMLKVAAIADDQMGLATESAREVLVRLNRVLIWLSFGRLLEHEMAWQARRHIDTLAAMGPNSRLSQLFDMMQHATIEMAASISDLSEVTDRAAVDIDGVVEDLAAFHRWLGRFRLLVTRNGLWHELGELRTQLDQQLVGVAGLERLRVTEQRCRRPVVDIDVERLARALTRVRTAVEEARTKPYGVPVL